MILAVDITHNLDRRLELEQSGLIDADRRRLIDQEVDIFGRETHSCSRLLCVHDGDGRADVPNVRSLHLTCSGAGMPGAGNEIGRVLLRTVAHGDQFCDDIIDIGHL